MKRIAAIILVLTLVFALASCGGDENTGVNLDDFKSAVSATAPATVKIEVTQSNDFMPELPLTAEYNVEYAADGSATVEYTYTQYNEIDETATDPVSTYTGSATIAPDGTVSGDNVGSTITSVASVNFNLDAGKMECTASMGILTAHVSAANTASVLGVEIGADVTLTLSTANGVVVGATIAYTLGGSDYEIVCTYN